MILHEKLAAVPVSTWEDELHILDACTRESQRIIAGGITLRRNVQKEMKIGKQVVERGNFLIYPMADVHLNPEYYPEPYKFDPGQWLRPDPVSDTAYPFLGWGAGRHPCAGAKMARPEMKLILALFLARYEYNLVDEDGKFPDPLPVPDRNDTHQVWVELRARRHIDADPVSLSPGCLGSSPRSYVLLRLREGYELDRLPSDASRPSSHASLKPFLQSLDYFLGRGFSHLV